MKLTDAMQGVIDAMENVQKASKDDATTPEQAKVFLQKLDDAWDIYVKEKEQCH